MRLVPKLEYWRATLLLAAITCSAMASNSPRQDFLHPPDEAKPRGYWIWPHGNFDYTTIRRELSEFKANGPSPDKPWREAQLKPSGLLGPVRLLFPQQTSLRPAPEKRTRKPPSERPR